MSSPAAGLVPVHIGQPVPGSAQERELLLEQRRQRDRWRRERAPRVPGDLAWEKHGLQPRWLGMESSDCAIAIEPGHFSGHGVDERDRFLAGAAHRGDAAVVIAVIGDVDGDGPRHPLSRSDASVSLSDLYTGVAGRRLPPGTRPEIVPDLSPADRDLAIRLLTRPTDAPWWALALHGATVMRGDGIGGQVQHQPQGQLEPILVDGLGDPLVAAWVSPAGDQRWYVLPDGLDWDNVLGWLIQRALPEYAPAVLRRARSPHFVDPDLQTDDELAAQTALAELEASFAQDKAHLDEALRAARARAEPVRYGLLYGTGSELVDAVAAVLTAAGLVVVDLDTALGATKSADLLVGAGPAGPRRLVEIKGVGGAAQEHLVGYLRRHLDTWPQLCPGEPVTGGVLVVNHQHKLHPTERAAQVYSRPEFVAALPPEVTVLSSLELFRRWRTGDWAAIRAAILGAGHDTTYPGTAAAAIPAPGEPAGNTRWWRRSNR